MDFQQALKQAEADGDDVAAQSMRDAMSATEATVPTMAKPIEITTKDANNHQRMRLSGSSFRAMSSGIV